MQQTFQAIFRSAAQAALGFILKSIVKAHRTGSSHFGLLADILYYTDLTWCIVRVIAGQTAMQTAIAFPESRLLTQDLVRFDK